MERIFEKKSLPLLGENMFFMINISKVSPLKINLPFQKCYACHPIENMLQTYSELPSLITNQWPTNHSSTSFLAKKPSNTTHRTTQPINKPIQTHKPLQVICLNPLFTAAGDVGQCPYPGEHRATRATSNATANQWKGCQNCGRPRTFWSRRQVFNGKKRQWNFIILCPEKAPREMPVKSVNFHNLCFFLRWLLSLNSFSLSMDYWDNWHTQRIFWILVRLK